MITIALGELVIKVGADVRNFVDGLNNTAKQLEKFGKNMTKIGEKLSLGLTAPIIGGMALVTGGTQELRNELSKLETNAKMAGANIEQINGLYKNMVALTGEADSSTEGLSNLLATGFKGDNLNKLVESLSGAAIKFKDTLKFEGLSDGLQETLATGAAVGPFAELLERSGVALDGFNQGLQAAIQNGTTEQYILDTLAKSGLNDVYNAYTKDNQALLDYQKAQLDLQMSMVKIGNVVLPIMTQITEKVGALVGSFDKLSPTTQKVIVGLAGFVAAAGPSLIAIGAMASSFSAVSGIVTKLAPQIARLVLGMGPVGIAIAAIVAAGVLLYKNWDVIKAKAQELWDKIKENPLLALAAGPIGAVIAAGVALYQNWDKVSAGAKRLWGAISDAWENIKAKVLSISKSAVQWGKDIVEGIINGIKAKFEAVKNVVGDLAESIISTFKSVLVMRSPSHVMMELGKNIAEGLSLGMKNAEASVRESALGLVDGMMQSVQQVTEQYNSQVAQAMESFKQQEEQLTQQYQQQLDTRTESLYNWIGIFDAVPEKMKVTGSELLKNLRDQVSEFTTWQTNIASLSKKAVDEGLIKELQDMGPKALPQIQALNRMSSTQLEEYVRLWQEKHNLAKTQSTTELEGLRTETWTKIDELRTGTNKQLAQMTIEFVAKIQEIKKSTLGQLNEMVAKGVSIGTDLINNIIKGIKDKKNDLEDQLDEINRMINIIGISTPTVSSSSISVPAMAAGGIVTRPTLALVGEAGPEAVVPLSRSVGKYGGAGVNNFYINVTGANARDIWEELQPQLERSLARAGVA